jgi:hypothetical protein
MITILFTKTELQILDYVATRRYIETSSKGKEMQQDTSRSPWQICLDGVYGEYAVGKHYNLFFDLNCDYRKFGADFVRTNGLKIDVKSTRTTGGPLNATKWSVKKPADTFILTEIYDDFVNIIGWVDRVTFLKDDNIFDVGNGPFYSLPQKFLTPINESQKTL